ncbi:MULTISPECIES: DNA polymerase III subunit gamma/tau [unclassified Pseudoalteromonas]|uniref:DNA polymerase III subunit gamma/tau n=1 Tax=unclassified Pseudoalteromonas TaxID=194690 RepID=UPI0004A1A783|nr:MULTISPECIES: DNA polymerase III subunit gamma/tau [unclassified Pseudoalteromonas]KDC56068.1 ATPase AAA [Pseudoalteromonas sp. S3431]MDQ2044011.1 DNA polymerase III subunit gamma/tau [Pseudoalteromonas sp. 20-92]
MSYQVLARKWRPQTFHELVGQSHVKQALVNALTQNRLHHAYLFTGTRGVGKTTIARIFAKSLNCDEGISANPCGQCSSCLDIEAGRYIDLLEIDAASRTKVEDTREILDNVQYAPTRGRYKVYLIDEVHMLSKHSFNALLKTLEEPPEHVKFLLATTDPQKLPVTILSRCLQFNLNALSQSEIKAQLEHVLTQEQLSYDNDALSIIAKAADGSMRDALSLTDQAIAQTNGDINNQAVQTMLGLMDTHYSQSLLAALLAQDGTALMSEIAHVASRNPNYIALLDDLIALTHLTQLTQLVPQAAGLDETNADYITHVAQHTSPQQIQIYYQLLLNGKKDLQWAPEPRLGFEMLMLRLLAFKPTDAQQVVHTANEEPVQNKQGRANALRDILNKNKTSQDTVASQSSAPVNNTKPVSNTEQPRTVEIEPLPNAAAQTSNNDVVQSNNEPAQVAVVQPVQQSENASKQQASANELPQTNVVSDAQTQRQSEDEAYMQHSDVEQTLAAQFDDVMSSAVDQGFNPQKDISANQQNHLPEHSTSIEKNSFDPQSDLQNQQQHDENASIVEREAKAQSAIARILRDRNISGSGKLSGTNLNTAKASSSNVSNSTVTSRTHNVGEVPKNENTVAQSAERPNSAVSQNHKSVPTQSDNPPWATDTVGESEKKPPLPVTGSQTPANNQGFDKPEKIDFKAKHQTITENLAPELLEQINPQKAPEIVPEEVSIPAPDDFQSPISEIRFAHQQDEWAYLIKRMGLGGRMRQFALHSIFTKQGNSLHIDVDESQKHLDTPMLRQRLDAALSSIYEHNVSLSINFAKGVIDSPYLIQQKIDAGRHQQAIDVITSDENIVQFQQVFSAEIDENSIQAL